MTGNWYKREMCFRVRVFSLVIPTSLLWPSPINIFEHQFLLIENSNKISSVTGAHCARLEQTGSKEVLKKSWFLSASYQQCGFSR